MLFCCWEAYGQISLGMAMNLISIHVIHRFLERLSDGFADLVGPGSSWAMGWHGAPINSQRSMGNWGSRAYKWTYNPTYNFLGGPSCRMLFLSSGPDFFAFVCIKTVGDQIGKGLEKQYLQKSGEDWGRWRPVSCWLCGRCICCIGS